MILETQATNANGFYQFVGVADGNYLVRVDPATVPSGYTQTYDNSGVQNDHLGQGDISGGNTVNTADFGYQPGAGVYSVGGNVWNDNGAGGGTAGNGTRDGGKPGIPGVKVCLYKDTNGNGLYDPGKPPFVCTTTDSNGNYTFPGVPNGNYVVVTDPSTLPNTAYAQTGDPDSSCPSAGCNHQSAVVVNNANPPAENFGYQEKRSSISGTVCDGNGNGDCNKAGDPAEPAMANVTVFLTWAGPDGIMGTADDVVTTATTDPSGNYNFPNLLPGVYAVTKVTPSGYSSLADIDGSNPNYITVVLPAGTNKTNQDFEVDPLAGSIGDRVWLDTDGDGVQDIGEPGLPNVVVELKDGSGNPIDSDPNTAGVQPTLATTDLNGAYLFTGVPAGSYQVDVVSGVPAGLAVSPGTTDPRAVTLSAGQSYLDADFGYTAPPATAVIGDYVWADVDADGKQDPGEVGIGGVTVELRGPGPDGILGTPDDITVGSPITTDPDGSYLFTNVAPGQYLVRVSGAPLAGYTPTSGPQSEGATSSTPVTVAGGDVLTDVDFGFDKPALYSISDRLWYDADRDGVLDAGESGIGGVTVNLLDGGGNVIATVTSNPDGTFTFPGVPDGSYTIQIADNSGQLTNLQTTTAPAAAGQRPVVVSGAIVTGVNFGYAGFGPIGDTIWSDANGNGVEDPGELGIGGVTVNLYFDDGDGIYEPGAGDVLIASRVTDAAGQYLFNDLPQGAFWVSVTAPAGYTQTGDPSQPGVPCTTCDNRGIAILTSLEPSDLDMDFGYRNQDLADVSGTVWNDTNSNGVQGAGEPGIAGVTVNLVNAAGKVVATTTTDSNGNYTFFDVPAGNYTVVVTDEANVLDGYTLTSGLDVIPVTVAATNISNVNFGYVRNPATGAIGDTVWHDANRDGVQNGAEPGMPNVVVELKDGSGNSIDSDPITPGVQPTVQTTDLNGQYLFDNLPAGNYTVAVVSGVPSGMAPTTGTANPSAVINLSAGKLYPEADFGYAWQTGVALGDIVWHDVDGDGIQDPGEPGIGGVSITVSGPSCPTGCTVLTDPDGSWLVGGLTAGTYTVVVTAPAGYNATPTNGRLSRQYVVPAGEDVLYADFGFTAGPTGAIGDTIYLDANGSGGQDGGEPGIGGVTLSLLNSSGQVVATTVTNANGGYSFSGLPNGAYSVVVTDVNNVLGGLRQTQDPDQAGVCTTCDNRGVRTISAGAVDLTVDFGYAPVGGTIGNQVWHDKDGDGLYEPKGNDNIAGNADDETGIEGVVINLYLDINNNGVYDAGTDNLVRTTVTDMNGQYQFTGLPAGKYLVDVASSNIAAGGVLEGFNKTTGAPGANNNSQADPYVVTLTSTGGVVSSNETADFGYDAPIPYSIAGTIFNDLNRNGATVPTQELGEPPISSVMVYLYRDLNGDGVIGPEDPVIGATIANATGDYLFTDLPPGKYVVSTDALGTSANGFYQTTQTGSSKPVQPVTISNANVIDQDFGYYWYPLAPLSVVVASFSGQFVEGNVVLTWETVSELNNRGFNLWRGVAPTEPDTQLNSTLIPSQSQGNPAGFIYTWTDEEALTPGTTYYYWLEDVDLAGVVTRHGPENVTVPDPQAVTLASFSAVQVNDVIEVSWEMVNEGETASYNLYRSGTDAGPELLLINVPSHVMGGADDASYNYTDAAVVVGESYWYWLEAVDLTGETTLFDPVRIDYQVATAVTVSSLTASSATTGSLGWPAAAMLLAAGLAAGLSWRRRSVR